MTMLADGTRLFKVLNPDGSPCHGGNPEFRWPMPTDDAPGEWIEVKGTLKLCDHPGLHLTRNPSRWYREQAIVCEAEYDGQILDSHDTDGKVSVRRARLVRIVTWADAGVLMSGDHVVSGSASVTASGSASVVSTIYHSTSAQVTLEHQAAHIDRRGGKLVFRSAAGEWTPPKDGGS